MPPTDTITVPVTALESAARGRIAELEGAIRTLAKVLP